MRLMATAPTVGKSRNTITGKIFNLDTKAGVQGLTITVYDLNQGFAPSTLTTLPDFIKNSVRLSSFSSDDNGTFEYDYTPEDLRTLHPEKRQLDLFLVIAAHDDGTSSAGSRVLYFTNPPRLNAGKLEFFSIGLPNDLLVKFGVVSDDGTAAQDQAIQKQINDYVRRQSDQQKLAEGIAAFHKNLTERALSDKTAFRQDFRSKFIANSAVLANGGVLLGENDDLKTAVKTVAESAIDIANARVGEEAPGVPVTLYLTTADRQNLFGSATTGTVEVGEDAIRKILLRTGNTGDPGTILIQNNPIMKYCKEHTSDETSAKQYAGLPINTPPAEGTHPDPGTGSDDIPITDDAIKKQISRLVKTMPSPDTVLTPEFNNKRPDSHDIEEAVDNFSLSKGPAEVTAFYDFHSLQIAFDFVWRQLFDEEIINLAYQADNLHAQKFGTHVPFRELTVLGEHAIVTPLLEVPAKTAAQFEITREEYNDLDNAKREKLDSIAMNLDYAKDIDFMGNGTIQWRWNKADREKYIQQQREMGELIIESVTQDDYYSLHQTLRDLHDRIKSKYEFTVFAADKDYHSVNFGLLNTYRQQWKPLVYQAGKLVRSIPLSPKEERKYSLKVTRNLKRSSKEAIKNNSSISSERSSTSRVESDIIAKAQNKTNFSLSTDGDYDLGIASGTSKTSFGVEAQNESSQSRRDFHESISKAAQEYKDERSWEDSTEETSSYEHTESGTIVNPNDELAVTYLFYELQRRYRISEQLYRVMPVVLVAQEVPSPEEITEAWVITNSWIINRFLIDDSFRPCLRYLTTKSVGDDFEVREVRKNLREQRNLVEMLKIEVSNASREADSRYLALQVAIDKRIKEESAENTDGWLSDAFESVFGGGQDPEAAKARELAAKDEVQHANEKLEKLSSSLQQEVDNLHKMTSEYTKAMRNLLDTELQVKHLLVHIRSNMLYYMQAIWSMEPPDQRFLRLHKVEVPDLEIEGERHCTIEVTSQPDLFQNFRAPGTTRHRGFLRGKLKKPVNFKPLAEVADLDAMLGFKGNYMMFPLKSHNALTEFMAAPYIDIAFGAMDPDTLSNINLEDYSHYVCCLHDNLEESEFSDLKPVLAEWLKQLLADPLRNGDELVVPTNSLFIEALPGVHPLLENFKLRHRELDVYKVQEDVRKAGMENLRLAARLLNGEREDPDVEKKIVVEGDLDTAIDVDDHN